MTKYVQRHDEEGFVVPLYELYRLACCDCGLVHDVVWSYDKKTKELGMAVRRNNKPTCKVHQAVLQNRLRHAFAHTLSFRLHDCYIYTSHRRINLFDVQLNHLGIVKVNRAIHGI